MSKNYLIHTRLSEPSYKDWEGFDELPIWATFREDREEWFSTVEEGPGWRSAEATLGGSLNFSSCLALTSKNSSTVRRIVLELLQEWPEVYVIDGASYAIYSKLFGTILGTSLNFNHWNKRRVKDVNQAWNLAAFISKDADEIEDRLFNRLEVDSRFLNKLRSGDFSEFTLLSPFLPENIGLSFFSKISNEIQLAYALDDEVHFVNLVEEFARNCYEHYSLHLGGCLTCPSNANCIPELTHNQVDYGVRLPKNKINSTGKKISRKLPVVFVPLGVHSFIADQAYKLTSSSTYYQGTPRSTEQFLLGLTVGDSKESHLPSAIEGFLGYRTRLKQVANYRKDECANCVFQDSCNSLGINTMDLGRHYHGNINLEEDCLGATRSVYKSDIPKLLEASFGIAVHNIRAARRFKGSGEERLKQLREVANVKLSKHARKAMRILRANEKYFFGFYLVPTSFIRILELSGINDSTSHFSYYGGYYGKQTYLQELTQLLMDTSGLEEFRDVYEDTTSSWAVIIPTRYAVDLPINRRVTKTSHYQWLDVKDFCSLYEGLNEGPVRASKWSKDADLSLLYLIKVMSNLLLPTQVMRTGPFGMRKSILPISFGYIHIPSDKFLANYKEETSEELLLTFITTFIKYLLEVSWPKRVAIASIPNLNPMSRRENIY